MNIDDRLCMLTRMFGINRSQVASEALEIALAAKLQSREHDIETLERLALAYFTEEKTKREERELQAQRREQDQYRQIRELEKNTTTDTMLLNSFHEFCATNNLSGKTVIECLTKDIEPDPAFNEDALIAFLQVRDLPTDLNRLRPLLVVKH